MLLIFPSSLLGKSKDSVFSTYKEQYPNMTSHAMQQCCAIGVKHEGAPKGEIKNVGESTQDRKNSLDSER